jgi:putative ABC transport system permease protein
VRFTTFILKNLLRRKTRTLLTVMGVSIPVLAVGCLVGIADGFRESFSQLYRNQGVDIIVTQGLVVQRASSKIDVRVADQIGAIPGVTHVEWSLVELTSFEEPVPLPIVPIQGRPAGHVMNRDLQVLDGRKLTDEDARAALLGEELAKQLGKKVGDDVDVLGTPFKVVGVVRSRNVFEDGSIFVPLAELQKVTGYEGLVTAFSVMVEDGPDKEATVQRICDDIKNLTGADGRPLTLSAKSMQDFLNSTFELKTASAMAWVTSAIALVIGCIGMLNTMIMSVFERTKEIGILRAIGWKRRRIVKMILGEAFILSLVGAVFGTLLGYAAVTFLAQLPSASLVVSGQIPAFAVAQGFAIALLVGLFGGLYPALRASKLSPTEAIRHE